MSPSDLAPANTKRAREGAAKEFLKILKEEDVSWDYLEICVQRESAPLILEAVVDKFGTHLDLNGGEESTEEGSSAGATLHEAEVWLVRQQGVGLHEKALKQMTEYQYSTAVTAADYQDAALLSGNAITRLDQPSEAVAQPEVFGKKSSVNPLPGIHSFVNRVLDRVVANAGVAEKLTSHSLRRDGAQHANGAGMRVQWIFDRGAWNMSATNKAFNYVFNTPTEDHKIGRVLSSRDAEQPVHLLALDIFDSDTQAKIRIVASSLFWSSSSLEMPAYNINARVLDTLMAYLLLHYRH